MSAGITEIYRPRDVSNLGLWQMEGLAFKVYGIVANGKKIDKQLVSQARSFVINEVPEIVAVEGYNNGLGFVIIHPGELGISVLAHWWVQGSVLCQHIHRQLWDEKSPIDTTTRPVIACVWELGLINAEQEIWRKTMMGATPDTSAYLETRAHLSAV